MSLLTSIGLSGIGIPGYGQNLHDLPHSRVLVEADSRSLNGWLQTQPALLTTLDRAHIAATKFHGMCPAGSSAECSRRAVSLVPMLPRAFASSQACLLCLRRHPRPSGSRSTSPEGSREVSLGMRLGSLRLPVAAVPLPHPNPHAPACE